MNTAFVSLGSNMGDAQEHVAQARQALTALPEVRLEAASPLYFTEPQGLRDQCWFVNQVLRLDCGPRWRGDILLQSLLEVESRLGRLRLPEAPRYGPRCIDIDLLLFGDEIRNDKHCQLPHPQMHKRAFVLVPLQDIAPQVTINGARVDKILQTLTYSVEGQKILQ